MSPELTILTSQCYITKVILSPLYYWFVNHRPKKTSITKITALLGFHHLTTDYCHESIQANSSNMGHGFSFGEILGAHETDILF